LLIEKLFFFSNTKQNRGSFKPKRMNTPHKIFLFYGGFQENGLVTAQFESAYLYSSPTAGL
jgi:hypothetical protein